MIREVNSLKSKSLDSGQNWYSLRKDTRCGSLGGERGLGNPGWAGMCLMRSTGKKVDINWAKWLEARILLRLDEYFVEDVKSGVIGNTDPDWILDKESQQTEQGETTRKNVRKELRSRKAGRSVTTEKVIYLPIPMLSENILDNR